MKRILSLLLCAVVVLGAIFVTACTEKEAVSVNVMALKGPTGMGMVDLMNKSDNGETKGEYNITLASAPDMVSAAVINGEVDIAAVPVNLASVLYNKTEGQVQVAAINTLGVLYMLELGDTITSVSDLAGKTIYATGQGSTPEYVLRYILKSNGIDPDNDVTIEYIAEHAELATRMVNGEIDIAVLPEPNVTSVLMNNADVRIALDLTDEWDKVTTDGSTLVQGVIIVNKKFAEENKDAVDTFLKEYEASVKFANESSEEAAALMETYGIVPKKPLALKAIPNCNITYTDGEEMQEMLIGMYNVLFEANPKSIGGKLPESDFYYSK